MRRFAGTLVVVLLFGWGAVAEAQSAYPPTPTAKRPPVVKEVEPVKKVAGEARAAPAAGVDRAERGGLSVTGGRFVVPLAMAGGAAILLGLQLVASARLRRVTAPRR